MKWFVDILLRILFYRAPRFVYAEEERAAYDRLFDEAISQGGLIAYDAPYPKHRFIQYVSETKNVVLHGSNQKQIEEFEPRQQTLYNGVMTKSVFATKDGVWPLFYAVLDKSKIAMNFRNGSIRAKNGRSRYHFYSLDRETAEKKPWTTGMLYFLPGESFAESGHGLIEFEEWVSAEPVKPLAKMEVGPQDFYFIDKVTIHSSDESNALTWVLYKLRTMRSKKRVPAK